MHNLTAIEIRDKFLRGEISASAIVKTFTQRINQFDGQIGAFLKLYSERAENQAIKLDEKRAKGLKLGRLAAIPIAIKDNIHVKGEITTCSSKFLDNYRSPFDATVTQLLEAEDAIILGKTNLDEFAMGSSTENSAYGSTHNPWDTTCTPGGSSGGSAAAVAARFCPIALGSDTGGSIRQPASFCGIVGFKPTYGRVSRNGLVAFASSLDQIGPFATNVKDAALIMEVIGRHCEKDSTSIPEGTEDYLSKMTGNIQGLKIGVPWQFLEGLQPEMLKAFNMALDNFKQLGAEIVDIDLSLLKYSIAIYYILATAEASTNLARFDGIRYGRRSPKATTLEEVYTLSKEEGFGHEVKRRILLGTYVLSSGYKDAYYKKAQKVRSLVIQQHKEAFKKCNLIAMPVTPTPAFKIGSISDPLQMYLADIYTIGSNLAGLPAVSIPMALSSEKKPLGFQLIGPQRADVHTLQVAYAYEEIFSLKNVIPELAK